MIFSRSIVFVILLLSLNQVAAQNASVSGVVLVEGKPVEFAQVVIANSYHGTSTNIQGKYELLELPAGVYEIRASYIGYETVTQTIELKDGEAKVDVDFSLNSKTIAIETIVVTGTKTYKRQTDSPVIVNVINSQTISNVQACNLSEGLKFQPGLRVETDCQTCNYTQLRMNGLSGGYSQILINGRPIFSPLTGLYGLEQVPANMIDRIEVIRGGGSSLYGSSAIGGTVNVITKIPRSNSYELNYNFQNIDNDAQDHIISGNATVVSQNRNSGISFFLNRRERDFFDANGDNYSELPAINNTSLGTNIFLLPKENQKFELSLSHIYEYRFGGEMVLGIPAHLAQQSEERTHDVWMGSADYQINFNNKRSSFIAYAAWQNTNRDHYTGIIPDEDTPEFDAHILEPPYGTSEVVTYNVGTQINHRINKFLSGNNVITAGAEFVYDDVLDQIPTYAYNIDQTTEDLGVFVQSDWSITEDLSLLSGIRMDDHNYVNNLIFSPRASLLYKLKKNTQFRLSYGTGFRAPQAFDTDLHIAFAGGGISRVSLSPDLKEERSRSLSASINFDKPMENWIAGFTVEGFYNRLNDAFFLDPIGEDEFGELFVKRNGDGATVQGLTFELRGNYNGELQLEGGFTLQESRFDNPVQYIDEVEGIEEFIRTPNDYGYGVLTYTPNDRISATANYVYTGRMKVPHFAGAVNQDIDEIITSPSFSDLSIKFGYAIPIKVTNSIIELYGGVKNIFDAYQRDFDIGKNRDSNFVYGPAQPRTIFVGVKLRSKQK